MYLCYNLGSFRGYRGMKKAYSLEESYVLLDDISKVFLSFLNHLMEIVEVNQINLVGAGNSISAGWTAIDNNVCPWIEKLKPFIDANNNRGLNIQFANFSIAGNNSNKQIYEFLSTNPSLEQVKEHFSHIFDGWKETYNGTLLENYVDKDVAMSFYPGGFNHLCDYYQSDVFTLTTFFGCTGELLDHLDKLKSKEGRVSIFKKEILYMQKLVTYLLAQSKNSYVTLGNFPFITRYIPIINSWIKDINKQIENCALNNPRTMYFDGVYLDLVNHYHGKLKLDNHPSLEWQYTSLYHYVEFLMKYLPLALMRQDTIQDKFVLERKYHALDYDGNMRERMKQEY